MAFIHVFVEGLGGWGVYVGYCDQFSQIGIGTGSVAIARTGEGEGEGGGESPARSPPHPPPRPPCTWYSSDWLKSPIVPQRGIQLVWEGNDFRGAEFLMLSSRLV